MIKKLFIISNLLLLAACDPFEGVISVKQQMIVKSSENSAGCNPGDGSWCDQIVNVTIPVGDHSAKLDFASRNQIQLKLKINGKKMQINLDLPKKLNVPDNGNWEITAADLGQDFSAQGNSVTQVTESGTYRGYESCNYQRQEYICYPQPQGCHYEYRTVYGQQQVEYFERRTNQQMSVNFVAPAQSAILAEFTGQRNFAEKIYRYRGQCY